MINISDIYSQKVIDGTEKMAEKIRNDIAEEIRMRTEAMEKGLPIKLIMPEKTKIQHQNWYCCPHCNKPLFPLRKDTRIEHMPFRCKACKHDIEVTVFPTKVNNMR